MLVCHFWSFIHFHGMEKRILHSAKYLLLYFMVKKNHFWGLSVPLKPIVCPKLTLTVSSVIFLSILDTAYWLRRWRSTCWGHRKEENVNSQQIGQNVFLLCTVIHLRKDWVEYPIAASWMEGPWPTETTANHSQH